MAYYRDLDDQTALVHTVFSYLHPTYKGECGQDYGPIDTCGLVRCLHGRGEVQGGHHAEGALYLLDAHSQVGDAEEDQSLIITTVLPSNTSYG